MIFKPLKPLLEWKPAKLSWHVPFLAALGVGLAVMAGLWFQQPRQGMLAATGAMVILYLPPPPRSVSSTMRRLAACGSGFVVCHALGAACAFHSLASALMLGMLTLLATAVCRTHRVPPPGSFFFVVTAAISCCTRFDPAAIPHNAAWVALGAGISCLVAFLYCRIMTKPGILLPDRIMDDPLLAAILVESSVIAFFTALSLLVARLLEMENPYWVPISCAAILQGGTFRAVWHRKVHRIVGTVIGMGLTWFLFPAVPDPVTLAVIVVVLVFVVESLVARNYGLAVIFITPLTVGFAEISSGGVPIHGLLTTRLVDIIFGSLTGAAGGWVLHHPRWCRRMEAQVGLLLGR
jgi:uncharacterized membrane protein YccC